MLLLRVFKHRLLQADGGDMVIQDLCGHLVYGSDIPEFPEVFFVLMAQDQDEKDGKVTDTDGVRYFAHPESNEPFLSMGYSDNGYWIARALLHLSGQEVCKKFGQPGHLNIKVGPCDQCDRELSRR